MTEDPRRTALVSVIVPVYDTEEHLDDCVRSIVAQRHPALDVILVDDGSTDSSPQLCDAWAVRDARVRVIHTANGGLSRARNEGLDVARGEYVTFVDADDVIGPEHVAHLVEAARNEGVGLVAADLVSFADGGPGPTFRPATGVRVVPSDEALDDIVRRGIGFASCGKLMAADVFRGLRFRPGADFEDLEILPRLFARTVSVAVSDAANYGYRQHAASLMGGHRRLLRASLLEVLSSDIGVAVDRHGAGSERAERLTVWYAVNALRILEEAARSGVRREPGYDREYRRFLARHLRVLLGSRDLSALYKGAVVLSMLSPDAFIMGFRVARRLKSTVAPNLRRAAAPG
ncbi:MAG TPA: glycosyltransferase [Ornithinibacter sp.]|nr:glycosyltransferase [Ornithinibacter sp.]